MERNWHIVKEYQGIPGLRLSPLKEPCQNNPANMDSAGQNPVGQALAAQEAALACHEQMLIQLRNDIAALTQAFAQLIPLEGNVQPGSPQPANPAPGRWHPLQRQLALLGLLYLWTDPCPRLKHSRASLKSTLFPWLSVL